MWTGGSNGRGGRMEEVKVAKGKGELQLMDGRKSGKEKGVEKLTERPVWIWKKDNYGGVGGVYKFDGIRTICSGRNGQGVGFALVI